MAFRDYKRIESVTAPGLNLPSWLTNVAPVTYERAVDQYQNLEKNDLALEQAEMEMERAEKLKKAQEEIAQSITEEDLNNPEAFYEKQKQAYLKAGSFDEITKILDDQRKMRAEAEKANQPRIMQDSSGTFALYPDLSIKDIRTVAKEAKGKAPKFEVTYEDPKTGTSAKVNILDPQDVAIAESMGFIRKEPSGKDLLKKQIDDQMTAAMTGRDLQGVTAPTPAPIATPNPDSRSVGAFFDKMGKEQPQVVRLPAPKRKDLIPKAR